MFGLLLVVLMSSGGLRPPLAQNTTFRLDSAGPAPLTGPLQRIEPDWSVTLGGNAPGRVAGADFIALRRTDMPRPGWPPEPQAVFVNGDRLPGRLVAIAGDKVRFAVRLAEREPPQELLIPTTALDAIWLGPPPARESGALPSAWPPEVRPQDQVLLRNRDILRGTLRSADAAKRAIILAGPDLSADLGQVTAIAFSTRLARSLRPRGPYGRLVLRNGARLSLLSAQADAAALTGKTLFGAAVTVPTSQIVALDLFQGKAVYLSDLRPRRYEFTPYLGVRWPFVNDGSVTGGELRLAGNTFDKGLGLHSQCWIAYSLAGRYRRFEALVGIDERSGRSPSGPGGSVRIQVLVDGKAADLGPDRELTADDEPRPIRVDVTGAKELTLVVKFGAGGDVLDHVDWCDARLVK